MGLKHLFFGFRGRISRQPWWLGSITIIATVIAGAFLVALIVALAGEGAGGVVAGVLFIALYAAVIYAGVALMVKRLHDLDRTGWWALLYYGVLILSALAGAADRMGSMQEPSAIGIFAGIANIVVFIWFLIWLGFLRGTYGPNRYGPDPLGATQADASF